MFLSEKRKGSIIIQVTLMFLACVLITGLITFYSQKNLAEKMVKTQLERRAQQMTSEVVVAVKEYPAYIWLLEYWYDHADELDIEYDAEYKGGTRTAEKAGELEKRYPDVQLRYATKYEIEKMSAEDQKKYAEVIYSWLITHVNEIKRVHKVDFLFCVLTEPPYDKQFFVFSAADEGAVRGTEYGQVYKLGVVSDVSEHQQEAMVQARQHNSHIVDAGDYVDYYNSLEIINDKTILVGMTYNYHLLLSEVSEQTTLGTLLSMLYQIILLAACLVGIYFLVLKPLKTVQRNIRLYKDKKDSSLIVESLSGINLNNEIGNLALDVSDLSQELDNYMEEIKNITADRERISAELNLANRIQHSMLPHIFPPFPDRNEFEIYATMDPAREVGGDFYDFFMIDENHLGLVMADVSGKGIPAALFMMISKTILQSVAMLGGSAEEILTKTNEALCSNNQVEMFVTVWVGILELSTGKITAANAGHEYPAIKKPGEDYELLKDKHGFVIGGMEESKYHQYEIILEPGSKLFLYTDGAPEATDENGDMFGTDRMIDALNLEPDADPENTLKNVRSKIDEFVKDAEQFDDLTMMCLEYKGEKGTKTAMAE